MTAAVMQVSAGSTAREHEGSASAPKRRWTARPLGLTPHLLRDIGLADVAPRGQPCDNPDWLIGFGAPRL